MAAGSRQDKATRRDGTGRDGRDGRDGTGRTGRDGTRRDETGRDGTGRTGRTGRDGTDGTGRDRTGRDGTETGRDETRRDGTGRDGTRRDETVRDGAGRTGRDGANGHWADARRVWVFRAAGVVTALRSFVSAHNSEYEMTHKCYAEYWKIVRPVFFVKDKVFFFKLIN